WTVTSTTTLFLGIEIGVLVEVRSSLAFVIHESADPYPLNYTKCFIVTMLHESVVLHEIVSESNSSVDLLKTEAEVKDCISRRCSRSKLIEYAEEVSPLCTKESRFVLVTQLKPVEQN
nr:probable sulfate transporter 4.2 [Tanacetum cinerariifolium]